MNENWVRLAEHGVRVSRRTSATHIQLLGRGCRSLSSVQPLSTTTAFLPQRASDGAEARLAGHISTSARNLRMRQRSAVITNSH
jgi:hypothetical protein